MGRMGQVWKALGPVSNVVGGVMDYNTNKAEGQDDLHAASEAIGATAGGWGGWEAGALAGAGIGAVGGPVGAAIGGLVGGIGGGFLGSTAGKAVGHEFGNLIGGQPTQAATRNNNNQQNIDNSKGENMGNIVKQQQQPDGTYLSVDDQGNTYHHDDKGNVLGTLAATGVGAGTLATAGTYLKNKFTNTYPNQMGNNALQHTAAEVGQVLNKLPGAGVAQKVWNVLPAPLKIVGGLVGAGEVADQTFNGGRLTNWVKDQVGNLVDTVTNQATDFGGHDDPMNPGNIQHKMEEQNKQAGLISNNPYAQAIRAEADRNRALTEQRQDFISDRDYSRGQERSYDGFVAGQANEMLRNYAQMPQTVANSVAQILQSHY